MLWSSRALNEFGFAPIEAVGAGARVDSTDLTVVIPMYNVGHYVGHALSSIAGLGAAAHVVVVDDASTDNSVDVARDTLAAHRIQGEVVVLRENRGLSAARNVGLDACKTDYLAFLDADDLISIRSLSWALSQLRADPQVDLVVMAGTSFSDSTGVYWDFNDSRLRDAALGGSSLSTSSQRSPWLPMLEPNANTRVFRTQFLRDHNLRFPEGLLFEDYGHHWLSMFWAKRVCVSRSVLLWQRQGREGQITSTRSRRRFDFLRVWDQAQEQLKALVVDSDFGSHVAWSALRACAWCGESLALEHRNEYWTSAVAIWHKMPPEWTAGLWDLGLSPRESAYGKGLQQGGIDRLSAISNRSLRLRDLPALLPHLVKH